jgi:hypothetical protein
LPPHEKDWIYNRATFQRDNLEYKIAYEWRKSASRNSGSAKPSRADEPNRACTQTGIRRRNALASSRDFGQSQKWRKSDARIRDTSEKTLQTIGFLIHNQTEANNLRVASWLEKQESEELKTAGEILKTFARATREIENNELTVTVKIRGIESCPSRRLQKLVRAILPRRL